MKKYTKLLNTNVTKTEFLVEMGLENNNDAGKIWVEFVMARIAQNETKTKATKTGKKTRKSNKKCDRDESVSEMLVRSLRAIGKPVTAKDWAERVAQDNPDYLAENVARVGDYAMRQITVTVQMTVVKAPNQRAHGARKVPNTKNPIMYVA